jgi:hypothetical protein
LTKVIATQTAQVRVFMDVVAALQKEDSLYPLVINFGKRKSSYLKMCSHEFTYFLGEKTFQVLSTIFNPTMS